MMLPIHSYRGNRHTQVWNEDGRIHTYFFFTLSVRFKFSRKSDFFFKCKRKEEKEICQAVGIACLEEVGVPGRRKVKKATWNFFCTQVCVYSLLQSFVPAVVAECWKDPD